jgi:hypothetical protein
METPGRRRVAGRTSADPRDESRGLRVDRRLADIGVPPVAAGEHLTAGQRTVDRMRSREMDDCGARENSERERDPQSHTRLITRPVPDSPEM